MNEDTKPQDDPAVAEELKGVPEELLESSNDPAEGGTLEDALALLRGDLEAAKQEALYAKAETQNVRRRLEKDAADARTYAATAFAREILSVADNLARALDAVPAELRADDTLAGFLAGIEATQREIDKAFAAHNITRIPAMGMPLDPHQHQAMLEVPSAEVEPGTIVQELQSGYMIKDRLLRPAMVAVAKEPE